MSEKILVICDEEFGYADTLANNIMEREELNVRVFTFTNWDKAANFFKERKIQILLIDETFQGYDPEAVDAEARFVLVRGEERPLQEGECPIYKYQRASHIIQEVFETYVAETDKNVFKGYGQTRTRLEAVYSPVRGIGKTRFAIALGKEWAKKEKVLYLNLEEYPGFEINGPDEQNLNIGDLLYFLKQSEGNLGLRLQSAVKKIGELDYVPPIYLSVDLKDVQTEEWTEFLQKLMELGFYDVILLDLGESIQGLFWILQLCDHIYMPTEESEWARQKMLRFEECLGRLKLEKILRVTQQFTLPEQVEEYVRNRTKEVE